MSEAPKKIWVDPDYLDAPHIDSCISLTQVLDRDTQYIRADIVEEMREALEEILLAERFSNRPPVTVYQAEEKLDRIKYAVNKAEAALAKARMNLES